MKKGRDMKAVGQRGFTLIELMITVAIVAILAAIAYPSYTQYVIRGHRAAAQAEMMDIANRQQQFFLANRSYAADLATLRLFATHRTVGATATLPRVAAEQWCDSTYLHHHLHRHRLAVERWRSDTEQRWCQRHPAEKWK
jgi:prepilin-type N-terminal cleavage/methylation domain-containing protein